ncbi:hypothetical protein FQR65_LT13415 [Abscondita terminalis]|nr:hypothetical protein FQR65_LT13415 [Abscondita terminalis]
MDTFFLGYLGKMAFVGIQFEDSSIELVCEEWFTPRKKETFWPRYKQRADYYKSLKSHEIPNDATWELHGVKLALIEKMNRQQSYLDKLPWDRKGNLNLEALTQKELDILFEGDDEIFQLEADKDRVPDNEVASDAEQEDHKIEVAESEEHNNEEDDHNNEEDDIQRESTQIRNNFIAADGTE